MDLKFYWYISSTWKDGVLRPRCSILNVDEALNIVNFLIDDEGLGIGHLQKWIKNGLEEINKISKKEISEYDMWGQSLGALISLDKVTIYWGDEEYPMIILSLTNLRSFYLIGMTSYYLNPI